jgi:hypothetical protein
MSVRSSNVFILKKVIGKIKSSISYKPLTNDINAFKESEELRTRKGLDEENLSKA